MRVIHLTTEFPWPATSGGPVRTLSQVRILASLPEVDSVTLLSVAEKPVPDADQRALAAAIPKLRVVPPVFHPIHLFEFKQYVPRVVALRALRGVPYLAGKWDSAELRRTLVRELLDSPVDVVYIDHLGMARYLREVKAERPHARTVLDQHNVESDFFKQFAEKKSGPKKLVGKMEHAASRAFEKEVLRSVDAVVAISREDAQVFEQLAGVKAHVVPVVMTYERKPRTVTKPNLCYVGSLRWHPNVAGLDWFCAEVWPKVRARVPDATLEIAGVGLKTDASGKPIAPETWNVPGVTTVGFLEDLEPLYERSIGMVAPILGGSGVRMKLLEGFRAGMPVATTPDGAFGLPLEDGKEALIARDPAGFAERIERLVRDTSLRDRLRQEGFAYLDRHHSLSVAQSVMRGVLGILP